MTPSRSGWRRCRGLARLAMALWCMLPGQAVRADAVPLPGRDQLILVNTTGGLPGRWSSCAPAPCADVRSVEDPGIFVLVKPGEGGSRLAWVIPGDPERTRLLENLEYEAELWRSPEATSLILRSREPFDGVHLVHRYLVPRMGHTLRASLQIPAGARLELRGGTDLAQPAMAGLGAIYAHARAVTVGPDGQATVGGDPGEATTGLAVPAGTWAGVRGRFWALLVRPDSDLHADMAEPVVNEPIVRLGRRAASGSTVALTFYGGPVARPALEAAAPELGGMLYASLWGWLRALAFGLAWLLARWQDAVGNAGLAIILLSLSVKLLMAPLVWVAERWQAEVNRIQSALAPDLAAVRRQWTGEEAHRRTLEVYARHGVSPWYTLKSLAGFLIQIPVFIAAFDMLGESFSLRGAGFLWIADLSLPDRVATLPVVLPVFGGHLNLLPLVMTAFTVLAARLQEDRTLTPELHRRQRLQLYGLAGLFLVLLYTFPAGMVLYWTANNLWHLLRVVVPVRR